ncbi:MAG: VanW family protein [Peptococcaceae bacterium]|nr:VanW family protein [Peptococcaceae bacterium]
MHIGKLYFTWRRYLLWLISKTKFARTIQADKALPFAVYKHETPLLRRLRNVDMWLQHNKIINLRLAVERINGVILKPGETFSFWRLVGKPTRRKGYVDGMVLCNGSLHPGVGGGICQLSNLIYWMTLHTPLTVTERWRHNYDVFPDSDRTQPFGSGATVEYNYIDLQIRNDTDTSYQLLVWVSDTHLHGEWRSEKPVKTRYRVYQSYHRICHTWWGGYMRHNVLRRLVLDRNNNQVADEFVTENQAVMMYPPLLSAGNDNQSQNL